MKDPIFFLVFAALAMICMIYAIFLRLWWQRYRSEHCGKCRYPKDRCDCAPKCHHAHTTEPRWSQDGWVSLCRVCGETVYLGDDIVGPKWPR